MLKNIVALYNINCLSMLSLSLLSKVVHKGVFCLLYPLLIEQGQLSSAMAELGKQMSETEDTTVT